MRRFSCALLFAGALALGALACNDSTSPPPDPNASSPDLSTLGVGQVRTLTFAQAQTGLTIPDSMSDADYLVVVSNIGVFSPTPEYVIRGNRGAAVEARVRNFERQMFSSPKVREARSVALRQQRMAPKIARAVAPPNVGDLIPIEVLDYSINSDLCLSTVTTTGRVVAVSDRAIIVNDTASPAGFTSTDYNQIAEEFDNITYPTGSSYFGNPSDIDDNSRVIIYYTPAINRMTEPGQANIDGYVGGLFFGGDLLDAQAPDPFGCPGSNEAEIFYLLTPDPTGEFGNQFSIDLVREITRGTVAHEFQHMINWGNRLFKSNALFPESGWLDEALAHFAEDATGRVALNIGDLTPITVARINQMSDDEWYAFFFQNFTRTKMFLETLDSAAPIGPDSTSTGLAGRGASWSMLRYAGDWFSNSSPRTLMRALALGPDTGVTNLTKHTRVPLDTILSRWLITLYTDNMNQPGLSPQYKYRSYELRSIINARVGNFPFPIQTIGSGASSISTRIPPSSAAYFLVSQSQPNVVRTVRVTTDGNTASTDANGRLYILRLQ